MSVPLPNNKRSASSIHLDAIRGLAALAVFAGHARDLFLQSPREALLGSAQVIANAAQTAQSYGAQVAQQYGTQAAQHYGTSVGRQAVIVFFVLSGYLVGGGVVRAKTAGSWSWRSYLTNRLTRLWVPLLPALLLGFLLDRFGLAHFGTDSIYYGPPGQMEIAPGLANRVNWSILLGNAAFLQGITVPTLGSNTPLWSLAYEFWFYIAFPFLYLLLQRGASPASRLGALVVLTVIGVLVGRDISIYFGIWLIGVAIAVVPASSVNRAVWLLATGLFVAANGVLLKYSIDTQLSDFLTGAAFSFMVYTILHRPARQLPTLYGRAAQGMSEMSYTLYVSHMPVLVLLCAAFNTPWHRGPLDFVNACRLCMILAAAFTWCAILWYCFERHTPRVRQGLTASLVKRGDAATV